VKKLGVPKTILIAELGRIQTRMGVEEKRDDTKKIHQRVAMIREKKPFPENYFNEKRGLEERCLDL